jgi:hypothetical protein
VLTNFLWDNKNIFAWKPVDMPGVPRRLAEHRIDINDGSKPVKQCLRHFSPYKKDAIKKEVTKLLAAGFIREILHPDWFANPVLVRKDSGEWRNALITLTSTNITQKTRLAYHALIRLLIQWLVRRYYLSSIVTLGIIRLRSALKIRARHHLSPRLVPTATPPCRLGSRMLAPHTNGQFKSV